ncbi:MULTISPECIES: hypothetical protein [Halobacteriovorax]|uniref:Glycerophosphoryl diester phosphodiesterase membrane domain-containing protein n=1 Tax=Halobacteriovorax vibrionivorans TaxID=2152716 RepID=A0ABY0IDC7_9BACT|nr:MULTISPECIES: hypothetical protein [Halobacteriovorax]RZF20963.1 hypothetical protein DAY19_13340 [Halobacteriovorax vibrionivorans]TGD46802.1 hypothetical protein EP118_10770 [Halobacteriovorax sp. Y22]
MDMQDNSEIETVTSSQYGIIEAMYDAISIMKERLGPYSILFVFSFLLKAYAIYNANLGDMATDMKIIEAAIVNVLGAVFQSVLILNFFFFALNGLDFKIKKVLWDIPTYVFFGFLMSLLTVLGFALFVIPGLYVMYFYMALPMVAILFDQEGESNFKITKTKVSSLGGTYAIYFVLTMIISGVGTIVTNYAPGTGIPMGILYISCLILTLVQDVMAGLVVALFNKA